MPLQVAPAPSECVARCPVATASRMFFFYYWPSGIGLPASRMSDAPGSENSLDHRPLPWVGNG